MLKIVLSLFLLVLLVTASPAVWGQGTPTNVRSAASLPSTCTPSSGSAFADALVVNNVYYVCTAKNTWTPVHGLESDNTWTNNNRFCGPIPWADITCFGARALPGGVPSTTATCVRGGKQVVIGAPNTFQVNDGVTIYGCGPTNSMGTPTGLKIVPSEPWGLADTRSAVPGPEGRASYEYTVVARDIYGALSAPAAPVTISSAQGSLGVQRANIRTLSRSNDRITVVTTEPNRLVVNALVQIEPKGSLQFGGWYNVAKVDSSTEFELWNTPTDTRAQGWMVGDTVSSSAGGSVAYYQENYLTWMVLKGAWEYYVCAKRPGDNSLKLIGVTKPTGLLNGYTDAAFEDYGSPYMDNQVFPSYVTDAICTGSATNDPLTTWVTAVASDGVTYTLHDAASQSANRRTIVFDDAPGILRALDSMAYYRGQHGEPSSFLGGAIYIPPSQRAYVINSYLEVPRDVTIWQSGKLLLNETVNLSGSDNWYGDWGSQGTPQFGLESGASVAVDAASPAVYLTGPGNSLRGLTITDQNVSGGTLLVADNAAPANFDYINFLTGAGASAKDYTGMAVILRDTTQTIANYHFHKISVSTGPDQDNDKSWSPSFWVAPGQGYGTNGIYVTMDHTFFNRRGIAWGGGHNGDAGVGGVFGFTSDWSYRQGGIIPYFACMGCVEYSPLTFNDASQDTEGQPLEAAFTVFANSGHLGPRISARNPTGGAQMPLFGGSRPSFVDLDGFFARASATQNRDILFKTGGGFPFVYAPYATTGNFTGMYGSLFTVGMPMHGSGGYSWWFDLAIPTQVSAKTEAGGGVPIGTWVYGVTAVGADNGETIMSSASDPVAVSSGAQTVLVKWNPSVGAYSYNVWRCDGSPASQFKCTSPDGTTPGNGKWLRVALHTAGTTYSDTNAAPAQQIPPQVTGTGSTIMNATGAYAPFFQAPPITVSQLPAAAAANAGEMRRVSDSSPVTTEGQKCVGSGSATALAFSNGAVWKCF